MVVAGTFTTARACSGSIIRFHNIRFYRLHLRNCDSLGLWYGFVAVGPNDTERLIHRPGQNPHPLCTRNLKPGTLACNEWTSDLRQKKASKDQQPSIHPMMLALTSPIGQLLWPFKWNSLRLTEINVRAYKQSSMTLADLSSQAQWRPPFAEAFQVPARDVRLKLCWRCPDRVLCTSSWHEGWWWIRRINNWQISQNPRCPLSIRFRSDGRRQEQEPNNRVPKKRTILLSFRRRLYCSSFINMLAGAAGVRGDETILSLSNISNSSSSSSSDRSTTGRKMDAFMCNQLGEMWRNGCSNDRAKIDRTGQTTRSGGRQMTRPVLAEPVAGAKQEGVNNAIIRSSTIIPGWWNKGAGSSRDMIDNPGQKGKD